MSCWRTPDRLFSYGWCPSAKSSLKVWYRIKLIVLFYSNRFLCILSWPCTMPLVTNSNRYISMTLLWRHNEPDCVSNHQPHDCLLNRLSGTDQRKHQSSASLAFVREIHRRPVNSLHKWPVTRKMFPFDDVIMDAMVPQCQKLQLGMYFLATIISRKYFFLPQRKYPHFKHWKETMTLIAHSITCKYDVDNG